MDISKKKTRVIMDIRIETLVRIHRHYLEGCQWAILSPDSWVECNKDIEAFEKILIGTGYLTEGEVKARHKEFMNVEVDA